MSLYISVLVSNNIVNMEKIKFHTYSKMYQIEIPFQTWHMGILDPIDGWS